MARSTLAVAISVHDKSTLFYKHRKLLLGVFAAGLTVSLFLAFPPAGIAPMIAFMLELSAFSGGTLAAIATTAGITAALTLAGGIIINMVWWGYDQLMPLLKRCKGETIASTDLPFAANSTITLPSSPLPISEEKTSPSSEEMQPPTNTALKRHRAFILAIMVAGITVGLFCAFPPASIAPMMLFLVHGFATAYFGGSTAAMITVTACLAAGITFAMGAAVHLFWAGMDLIKNTLSKEKAVRTPLEVTPPSTVAGTPSSPSMETIKNTREKQTPSTSPSCWSRFFGFKLPVFTDKPPIQIKANDVQPKSVQLF